MKNPAFRRPQMGFVKVGWPPFPTPATLSQTMTLNENPVNLTGKHVLKKHGMSQPNLINFSVLKKCWNKFEVSFTKCWSSKNINHPWTCKQTPSAQSYSHITCTKNVNYVFSLISFTHTRLIWADEGCPIRPIWVDSSLVLTIWLTKIQFVNIHRWNQHDLSPLMSTGHARSRFARH